MKYINKLFLVLFAFVFVTGCQLFELEGNLTDPNAVGEENADFDLVMNNIMVEFVEFVDEASDETMPYVRMVTMQSNRYDNADDPSSFDFLWYKAYAELIPDIDLVIDRAGSGGFTVHTGVAKILKAYILTTLVDLFGDVPYSEAWQGADNFNPKTDPGADVYSTALSLLDSAIDDLNSPLGSIGNDLYYGGNIGGWIGAANALKFRYFVNTRLVNSNAGASAQEIIDGGNLMGSGGDWAFQYGTSRAQPDSRHPYYSDGYEVGGPSWYMANYHMWSMFADKNSEDPRLRYYYYRQDCDESNEDAFTLDCYTKPYPTHWPEGYPWCTASKDDPDYSGYWGRDHGNDDGIPPDDLKRTAWGIYPAGGKFDGDNCVSVDNSGTDGLKGAGIQPIVMANYVSFMRAEAALTMGTSDDARAMLEDGVRGSIDYVMSFGAGDADAAFVPSSDDVEAYVSEVLTRFDASGSDDDKLNVVMTEYWLASHGNGLEAYNGYRRTCKPEGMQPTRDADPGDFARSMWYPAGTVGANSSIDQKPGVTNPVFWDNNDAGCTE